MKLKRGNVWKRRKTKGKKRLPAGSQIEYVPIMFSPKPQIRNKSRNVYFSTNDVKNARYEAAKFARDMLNGYQQGTEKRYSVDQAIVELEDCFGDGAVFAVRLIKEGARATDEMVRLGLFTKAIDLLNKQVRADYVGD